MSGFAAIDFETTGFSPQRGDRIVEVGVVQLDEGGRHEGEWTTLLNPERGVGATHIHGITASDVAGAPSFSHVAPHLIDSMAGRTLVAHNAQFDMRFLHHELVRAGYALDVMPVALCSMKWSGRFVGPAKLRHACEALGIGTPAAHSALGDARATAELLTHLLLHGRSDPEFASDVERPRGFLWPAVDPSLPVRPAHLRSSAPKAPDAWIDRLVDATYVSGASEQEAAYMLVLDRALLDHQVSNVEGDELVEAARENSLARGRVQELHRQYLDEIATQAWADGVVTKVEQEELEKVAAALRINADELSDAIERARVSPVEPAGSHIGDPTTFLQWGDRIVFTGTMLTRSRDEWLAACAAVGLSSGGVTKNTRLLVADDGDTFTGKAKKARDYGVPVIDEATFVKMFHAFVERLE